MTTITRVLIVDDSAFVRKVIRQMLTRSPFIEVVGAARDGQEALELAEQHAPDLITLDLNMPHSGGLAFLKQQMAKRPLPVIIVSMADKDGHQVLEALEAGAVDVVQKPTGLATEKLLEISDELIAKVKLAAATEIRHRPLPVAKEVTSIHRPSKTLSTQVVVIGVSTGGPQALKYLIPQLPADFPVPIAIVLHMPVGYTELFARSLNKECSLEVVEAREDDLMKPGRVLLAPAGCHLTFNRVDEESVEIHLDSEPSKTLHRPSVDVLFRSAAETYGEQTLGVVLTGMGSDGTEGAAWIKAQGGQIIAEDAASCVVYGMPRSVIEAGLCDKSAPLGTMAKMIMEAL